MTSSEEFGVRVGAATVTGQAPAWKYVARRHMNRLVGALATVIRAVTGLWHPSHVSVAVIEQSLTLSYPVTVRGRPLRFQTLGWMPLYRARTLFTKEPETIRWLETIGSADVLFDVGANVGMYSIYAGACGAQVCAFEPVFTNYFILNSNVQMNGLSDRVRAYCLAISDSQRLDSMRLSSLGLGVAHNSFGENTTNAHHSFVPVFEQGALSWSLDDLVYGQGLPCPTHIKVDVDGLEGKVISGARRLLGDQRVRSIIIELNHDLPADQEAEALIRASGFTLSAATGGRYEIRGMQYSNMIFERVHA